MTALEERLVWELRAMNSMRGLPRGGRKAELIQRIRVYDTARKREFELAQLRLPYQLRGEPLPPELQHPGEVS